MNELEILARELDVNERTLRRGVNCGLVRAERLSPRRLRLRPGESRYLRRHWPLLAQLRAALRTERGVHLAVLFGSAARGDDVSGSDVDVLVSLEDESLMRLGGLSERLSAATGCEIQLVRLGNAEAAPWLLGDILREGRVLIDRSGKWGRLQAKRGRILKEADRRGKERRQQAWNTLERLAATAR